MVAIAAAGASTFIPSRRLSSCISSYHANRKSSSISGDGTKWFDACCLYARNSDDPKYELSRLSSIASYVCLPNALHSCGQLLYPLEVGLGGIG